MIRGKLVKAYNGLVRIVGECRFGEVREKAALATPSPAARTTFFRV